MLGVLSPQPDGGRLVDQGVVVLDTRIVHHRRTLP
jgi:hypothetical protein